MVEAAVAEDEIGVRVCDSIRQVLMAKLSALAKPFIPPVDTFIVEPEREDGNIVINLAPSQRDEKIRGVIDGFCNVLRVKNNYLLPSEKWKLGNAYEIGLSFVGRHLASLITTAHIAPAPVRNSSFRNLDMGGGKYSLVANNWKDMLDAVNKVLPEELKIPTEILGRSRSGQS